MYKTYQLSAEKQDQLQFSVILIYRKTLPINETRVIKPSNMPLTVPILCHRHCVTITAVRRCVRGAQN